MFYQPVIERSYLVEVQLTSIGVNERIPFLDIPQLRKKLQNVVTYGISAYTSTQLAKTPNSLTTVQTVVGLVVTFYVGDKEEIFQMPVIDLVAGSNSGLIRGFRNKKINFPKSYITILDATNLNVNESVPFNIIYKEYV